MVSVLVGGVLGGFVLAEAVKALRQRKRHGALWDAVLGGASRRMAPIPQPLPPPKRTSGEGEQTKTIFAASVGGGCPADSRHPRSRHQGIRKRSGEGQRTMIGGHGRVL